MNRDNILRRDNHSPLVFILAFAVYFTNAALFGQYDSSGRTGEASPGENRAEEQEDPAAAWFSIRSGFFIIYCDRDVDLKEVEKNISRRSLFSSGVYDPNPASAPPQKVAYMLDRIMKRVRQVLDMYPDTPLIKIKIFKDRKRMNAECASILGKESDYKSCYINGLSTIYTSEEDISDAVMSHEMGHVVVDHYFSDPLPEKIREVLSQYVELHLEE